MMNPTLDVYRDYSPAGKESGLLPLVEGARVLEIGFGGAKLLQALRDKGNDVYGVDASQKLVDEARAKGFANTHLVDISETPLPFEDDFFDAVYAYEVFEHLTNPHRMFYEARRALKKHGLFFFSVPTQEIDMGYGPNRHTFVYPGLLERENLERFIMQMYFKVEYQIEPTVRDHLLGRNFILRNMKPSDKADVVEVIVGNHNVRDLYGFLLSEERLAHEIEIEVGHYLIRIEQLIAADEWALVLHVIKWLLAQYPECPSMYLRLVEILLAAKGCVGARKVAQSIGNAPQVPAEMRKRIDALLNADTVAVS